MTSDLHQRSERYLDELFGPGAGARHSAFLDRIEHPALRDALHGYHVLESDTRHLSIADNYLLGMTVLCAQRAWVPAAMFAKTLLHLGRSEEHTSELQSLTNLVCRLLLEKKKKNK